MNLKEEATKAKKSNKIVDKNKVKKMPKKKLNKSWFSFFIKLLKEFKNV